MRPVAILLGIVVLAAILAPTLSSAQDSFFDIFTELSVVPAPPYPNTGHQGALGHMVSGAVTTDGDFSVVLTQCKKKASGLDYPTNMTARSSSSGVGDFAVDSFFDITYSAADDTTTPKCNFCVDSFFDITFSYTGVTGAPGALASLHTEFPVGDVRRYFDKYSVDSFFDITYEVDLGTDVRHRLTIHGSVPPELRITNVYITLGSPGSVDSFFDVFVEITPLATPKLNDPALTLSQFGSFNPPSVPTDKKTWGGIKSLYE